MTLRNCLAHKGWARISRQRMSQASLVKPRISPVFKEYEDGKHRRYELLFKVNGEVAPVWWTPAHASPHSGSMISD